MKDRYIVLGKLDGRLAAPLMEAVEPGLSLAEHQGSLPVVLSGSRTARLTESEAQALRATFEAGHPVLLVNVTSAHVDALHAVLRTGHRHTFAPGVYHLEAYGFNREPDGSYAQGSFSDPETEARTQRELVCRNENGTTVSATLDTGCIAPPDGPVPPEQLVAIRGWIADAGKRRPQDRGSRSRRVLLPRTGRREDEPPNKLTELARSFVDTFSWTSTVSLPFSLGGRRTYTNHYQVTTYVYSCYSADDTSSWFFFEQHWVLNASNSFVVDTDKVRMYYVTGYGMNAVPAGFSGDTASVGLLASSPGTTEGGTAVTSSVSFGINGTVGFEGKAGAGSVTGGMTVSSAETFEIPDVSVQNLSAATQNNASWKYSIPKATLIQTGACDNTLNPAKLVSRSTFQPVNQWLWKVGPREERFSADLSFTVTVVGSTIATCNAFGCSCDVVNVIQEPVLAPHHLSVPFPPVPPVGLEEVGEVGEVDAGGLATVGAV